MVNVVNIICFKLRIESGWLDDKYVGDKCLSIDWFYYGDATISIILRAVGHWSYIAMETQTQRTGFQKSLNFTITFEEWMWPGVK